MSIKKYIKVCISILLLSYASIYIIAEEIPEEEFVTIEKKNIRDGTSKTIQVKVYKDRDKRATINSDNVHIRDYPSLDGNILGKFQEGQSIRVYGRTAEKMRIGDMNTYWIQGVLGIENSGGVGIRIWIYGHFLSSEYPLGTLPVVSEDEINSKNKIDTKKHPEFTAEDIEKLIEARNNNKTVDVDKYYDNFMYKSDTEYYLIKKIVEEQGDYMNTYLNQLVANVNFSSSLEMLMFFYKGYVFVIFMQTGDEKGVSFDDFKFIRKIHMIKMDVKHIVFGGFSAINECVESNGKEENRPGGKYSDRGEWGKYKVLAFMTSNELDEHLYYKDLVKFYQIRTEDYELEEVDIEKEQIRISQCDHR